MHFERPIDDGIKVYDVSAGNNAVEDDHESKEEEPVAGEADETDASDLNVGDDEEKNTDLD